MGLVDNFPVPARRGAIVAHRGASAVAPENTLAAFRAARGAGAGWVEFDVQCLGDGTAVIHHDATLDRCTDGAGPLAARTAADLAELDAGGWFAAAFRGEPVPTLDAGLAALETLDLFGNLEIKADDAEAPRVARAVAEALGRRPAAAGRLLVSSFAPAALPAMRALVPGMPLAFIAEEAAPGWSDRIAVLGAATLHLRAAACTADVLEEARASGAALRLWTVNDPRAAAAFRRPGLAGVITDDPAAFLADPDWAAWAG